MPTFQTPIDIAIFVIEIIGCISFGTSGAITALRKKADILGVWLLTLIEVFGGGLFRDLVLQQGVPHIFWDPNYLILAGVVILVSTFWFVMAACKKTAGFVEKHRHDSWIYILDAIGIAVFCTDGVRLAGTYLSTLPGSANIVCQYIYLISLGTLTGVGGGIFRDVFIGEIPSVFTKHFYMTPCIIGCLLFSILYLNNVHLIVSIAASVALIVGLRVLAIIFQWNMPTAKAFNTLLEEKKQNTEDK